MEEELQHIHPQMKKIKSETKNISIQLKLFFFV